MNYHLPPVWPCKENYPHLVFVPAEMIHTLTTWHIPFKPLVKEKKWTMK